MKNWFHLVFVFFYNMKLSNYALLLVGASHNITEVDDFTWPLT